MKKVYLLKLLLLFNITQNVAQVTLVQFSTGFTSPVDLANAGDSRVFVVEQAGRIFIVDSNGVRKTTPFLDIRTRVLSGGERGLLGLAFPPNYASTGYFYVNYTMQTTGATRISRFSRSPLNPDTALSTSEQVLLTIYQPFSNHNGGNLEFGPDGYLYIGMGDGGSGGDPGNRAQNLDSLLGKMLRIDVSGIGGYTIPATNPFVGVAGRDEIWAYGLRNPWRWSFDRLKGDLWIGDVGQLEYEEIDFQPKSSLGGQNYGWRCYEGNHTYNTAGCGAISNYVFPVLEVSQTPTSTCAIVGGYVYRGAEYSNLFGKYFLTDECNATIKTLVPDGIGGFTLSSLGILGGSTLVSFGEDKWGELYVIAYGGTIYKFQGTACSPVAYISDQATIHACYGGTYLLSTPAGNGFNYVWKRNGITVQSGSSASYLASIAGSYTVTVTNRSACSSTSTAVNLLFDSNGAGCPATLDTKVFIEGFYTGGGMMNNFGSGGCLYLTGTPGASTTDADSIYISAMTTTLPSTVVDQQISILHTDGTARVTFKTTVIPGNNYYIRIRHRNSIETWSASPINLVSGTNYLFTTAKAKAYGNNMTETFDQNGWAMYSGDIARASPGAGNQDGVIESQDYSDMENALYFTLLGYVQEDITGDGVVESSDYSLIEGNVFYSIVTMHP